MKNYKYFPGMRDGKMCIYIEYDDGYDDILFYEKWDLTLSENIDKKAKKHFIEIRKEKLKALKKWRGY
jgi:hypothetical protein